MRLSFVASPAAHLELYKVGALALHCVFNLSIDCLP